VADGPILLETQVVSKNARDCESFLMEWNEVCDNYEDALNIEAYLNKFEETTNRDIVLHEDATGEVKRVALSP
jgi:hypothetical protein